MFVLGIIETLIIVYCCCYNINVFTYFADCACWFGLGEGQRLTEGTRAGRGCLCVGVCTALCIFVPKREREEAEGGTQEDWRRVLV